MPRGRGYDSARPTQRSGEQIALQQIVDEDAAALKAIAAQAGPAPGQEPISDAHELTLWGLADPNVDPDLLEQRLVTQGIPQEEAQSLALLQEHPELLPLFVQPTGSLERARMLARLAARPYRLSILGGYDDPEEQTKKAEALHRAWQKRMVAPLPVLGSGFRVPGEAEPPEPRTQNPEPAVAGPAPIPMLEDGRAGPLG